ncbi:MAG: hypothetical protein AAF219_01055 [Myxococcota bacterium]
MSPNLILLGFSALVSVPEYTQIRSTGAVSPPVYEYVLARELGEDWSSLEDAPIQAAIERFLQETGYEIGRVRISWDPDSDERLINIDEGVLDGIVFPNGNGLQAFTARALINLPAQAYNRFLLRQELNGLQELLGVQVERVEIVALDSDKRTEALLDDQGQIERLLGASIGDYQLRIYLRDTPFGRGFRLRLRGESPDGLVLNALYKTPPVLMGDDAFETGVEFGIRSSSEPTGRISRGGLRAAWISPAIIGEQFRLRLGGTASVIQRGRPDLDVDRFVFVDVRPGVGFDYEINNRLEIFFRVGAQSRELLEIEEPEGNQGVVRPTGQLRPFASIESEFLFGAASRQAPYRHEIDFELSAFVGEQALINGVIEYQKALAFGWDALFLEAAVEFAALDPALSEERRVSDRILGAFGDENYTSLLGSLQTEYRIAFGRDRLAFGPIASGVIFENDDDPGFGSALGAGVHGRVLDNFSVSFYTYVGFATDLGRTFGVSFGIDQIF